MTPSELTGDQKSLDAQFLKAVVDSKWDNPLTDRLQTLLALGAHVDGAERDGMPMRHAITKTSESLVNFLIASHANVHAELPCSHITSTLLHWAAYQTRSASIVGDFRYRLMLTNTVAIIAAGADPEKLSGANRLPKSLLHEDLPAIFQGVFKSTLHAAIELNRPDLCVKLLERGHDPNEKSSSRRTAWSAAKKSPECLGAMQAWLARQAIESLLGQENRLSRLSP